MSNIAATMCADMTRNALQLAREGAITPLFAKKLVYRSYQPLRKLSGSLDDLTDQLNDTCSCCLRGIATEYRVIVRQRDTEPPRQLVFTEDIPWGALCKQCALRLTVNIRDSQAKAASAVVGRVIYTGKPSEFLAKALAYEERLHGMIVQDGAEFQQLLDLGTKFRRSTDPAYFGRAIGILLDECKVCVDIIEFVTNAFLRQYPDSQQTANVCGVIQSANFELARAELKAKELLETHGDHTKLYQSAVLLHGLCTSVVKIADRIDVDTTTKIKDAKAGIYLNLVGADQAGIGSLEDVYYQTLRDWNEDVMFLDQKLEELMYIGTDSREYAAAVLQLIKHIYKMCTGQKTPAQAHSRIGLLRELYTNPNVIGKQGPVFRDALCSMFERNPSARAKPNIIANAVGLWSAEFVEAVDDFISRAQKSGFGMTTPDFVHDWEGLLKGHSSN